MEKRPLVSFILTAYNLPVELLRECIDSILALSLRASEREIILVDDGSAQSPMNDLMDLAGDIIYIRQSNKGLSEARNMGLRMAIGEYVQFVDGDDKLVQAPYEHCIDLVRFDHPEMVVFDFTRTDADSTDYKDSPTQSGTEYLRNSNIRGTAWGYLFRRSILGDLRFTSGIFNEDEEFTPLLILRAESVCVTNAKAYYYRQRPGSIITGSHVRTKLKRLNDTRALISRLNTLADRLPIDERLALQRRVAQLTMDYVYNVIRLTQSRHYLERKIESLRQESLFPLPDHDYTTKYTWFRRMTNSATGLNLLMRLIPLLNKER